MTDRIDDDGPVTAEEVLQFGPVVESAVWNLAWIAEARAPIAQAAGRPKLGKVFDDRGVGKAVLIRPCMSRGRRIRGLSPVYTPSMLAENATVFTGWPMYMDHVPAALAEAVAKRGRSVKELGGQVLTPLWDPLFEQDYDGEFGYQQGAVIAEVWANEFVRKLVGQNPNALHTSISAWPKSGKPGPVPWKKGTKGMVIEGIRRQPAGSVDFVPRGGAGGRMLLAEGADADTSAWPEPQWDPETLKLAISIAESLPEGEPEVSPAVPAYASAAMSKPLPKPLAEMSIEEFRAHLQESAPHLVPALSEGAHQSPAPAAAAATPSITMDDVKALIAEAKQEIPSREEIEEALREEFTDRDTLRAEQREMAEVARVLISEAEGVPKTWKADLIQRYAMKPEGAPPALLVEAATGEDGKEKSALDVLRENVIADLKHARDIIAEATGKPRVTQEGGAKGAAVAESATAKGAKSVPYWREGFAQIGVVESADTALSVHGVEKVEG